MSQSLNTLFGVIIFHNFLPDSGAKFWRQTFSRSKTFVPETKKKYFLTRSSELKFSRLDRLFFYFCKFLDSANFQTLLFLQLRIEYEFHETENHAKSSPHIYFLTFSFKKEPGFEKTLPNSSFRFLKNQKWSITLSKRWIQKMKIKNEKKSFKVNEKS